LSAGFDQDHTLVAALLGPSAYGFAGERVIVRWIDGNGAPLTPWTDAGDGGDIHMFPSVGGGVAVEVAGRLMSFASGSATPQPAPSFLTAKHDLVPVRGGRAYALVPRPGYSLKTAIELYAPSGKLCGTIDMTGMKALAVGRDGTVIGLDENDWCAASWWPHLLR
jgi:hypothetical protein